MRLLEIYDPKPTQNSTERGAGYGMRSDFPVSFPANISDTCQQDPLSRPVLRPHLCPPGLPPFP